VVGGRKDERMPKYQVIYAILPVYLQGGRAGERKESAPPRGKCDLMLDPPLDHHEPGKLSIQFK